MDRSWVILNTGNIQMRLEGQRLVGFAHPNWLLGLALVILNTGNIQMRLEGQSLVGNAALLPTLLAHVTHTTSLKWKQLVISRCARNDSPHAN
jgi:hypothetical protein